VDLVVWSEDNYTVWRHKTAWSVGHNSDNNNNNNDRLTAFDPGQPG